ncbi:ferritin family protein [Aurantimonas sp. HBX-1]|uniref:ferritin-like domain-containing protein n=1 Tax=Aurantimonas sp. HBX-1 TaxID=2906072 RepID=UPI001F38BD95|nr:ferritin family protein [Aurantimonas sp. HBX-1]UIJ72084.1 ferritin family protein [Aurantimonas sp. HBX-1]
MTLLKSEPFAAVTSMDELLAIASAMEQEAIDGYSALARLMRQENRPDMEAVFEQLVAEENQHLGNVVRWSENVRNKKPDPAQLRWEPADTFDDEGARSIAPALLTAYRAFSMAARNEERAFLFWTYVAANADQPPIQEAAERMAREEMGHLTTLRRERRRAFHEQRAQPSAPALDIPELESRLAGLLAEAAAGASGTDAPTLEKLAAEALERSSTVAQAPLGKSPLLRDGVPPEVSGHLAPLSELLLDCYLDLGERLVDQDDRDRAQRLAAGAIRCRAFVRSMMNGPKT